MVPRFERLLVPTDFSPTSAHALEYAVALARHSGAAIHLLHVLNYPVEGAASPEGYWVGLSELRDEMKKDATRQLAELAATLAGVTVTTEVLEGNPARSIVQAAKDRDCQLIVMGTHGRSGFSHLILGSVAERVVRTAARPVLTVSAGAEAEAR
jgi:nucleotide-binding universal stress UspA family protein